MTGQRAQELLCNMLGDRNARFRAGQLESILACVDERKRLLVVQKTGWGKSFVYFIATKILRERNTGPTLLISPLLSLMRNQVQMAARIGVRAQNLDSTNSKEWGAILKNLEQDAYDVLLISPERLASGRFLDQILPAIKRGIGMFVVDEAHCISDWGHDFRPDYRRILRLIKNTPSSIPILATTATANDRVIDDICEQIGDSLLVARGPLMRESLHIQTIHFATAEEKLAWLAKTIPGIRGSGIVYCLTTRDCETVAAWLRKNGVHALAYHARLHDEEGRSNAVRQERENLLTENRVKVLVATVALGMGFDKPDLAFVVHYQRPGSLVAYYQQIGRAGRSLDKANVVLLHSTDDDAISSYFIETAFPEQQLIERVLKAIQQSEQGLAMDELEQRVNASRRRLDHCLKYLSVEQAIYKQELRFRAVAGKQWKPDLARQERLTALRFRELEQMKEFCATKRCYMEFVSRALDDPHPTKCGKCANCVGRPVLPDRIELDSVLKALEYLRQIENVITPRVKWPLKNATPWRESMIAATRLVERGRALSSYNDAGWGRLVRQGKYADNHFADELVKASAELIRERWKPEPAPVWVTAIPSLRRPTLVDDFARRLAAELNLPYLQALRKIYETEEQKTMQNSVQQLRNLVGAFSIDGRNLRYGPVLLVDDVFDSRWTLTYAGALLRDSGVAKVFPFTLAFASTR